MLYLERGIVNLTIELPDDLGAALKAKAEAQGISPGELVREGLELLEKQEREDREKLEWLRAAAKEAFEEIERDEYTELTSREEIRAFLGEIHEEVASVRTQM
jgi:Arc/MetJ-type ribon-helix-helix transcriptional regulator